MHYISILDTLLICKNKVIFIGLKKNQGADQEGDHEQILRKRCIDICDSTVQFATQVGCLKWHGNVNNF
jgi:hypothetical protein